MPGPENSKKEAILKELSNNHYDTAVKKILDLTPKELENIDKSGVIYQLLNDRQQELTRPNINIKNALEKIENAPGNKNSNEAAMREALSRPEPRSDAELAQRVRLDRTQNGGYEVNPNGLDKADFERACDWINKDAGHEIIPNRMSGFSVETLGNRALQPNGLQYFQEAQKAAKQTVTREKAEKQRLKDTEQAPTPPAESQNTASEPPQQTSESITPVEVEPVATVEVEPVATVEVETVATVEVEPVATVEVEQPTCDCGSP